MGARTPAEAVDRFFFHELWACILPRRLQESHAVLEMASGQYARDEVERSVRTCTQSTTPPSFKPSLIGSHTSGARQRGGVIRFTPVVADLAGWPKMSCPRHAKCRHPPTRNRACDTTIPKPQHIGQARCHCPSDLIVSVLQYRNNCVDRSRTLLVGRAAGELRILCSLSNFLVLCCSPS